MLVIITCIIIAFNINKAQCELLWVAPSNFIPFLDNLHFILARRFYLICVKFIKNENILYIFSAIISHFLSFSIIGILFYTVLGLGIELIVKKLDRWQLLTGEFKELCKKDNKWNLYFYFARNVKIMFILIIILVIFNAWLINVAYEWSLINICNVYKIAKTQNEKLPEKKNYRNLWFDINLINGFFPKKTDTYRKKILLQNNIRNQQSTPLE